ncbi:MAG: transglutaminase family protein [Rhodospirillaceae bacterium]
MQPDNYLAAGRFIESDDPLIIEFAERTAGSGDQLTQVLRLFHAVRDDILYDPYVPMGDRSSYSAKATLTNGRGWCVSKAALLTACCRVIGVPARPGYADVMNHLATEKLLERMGSDIFAWHSYADIWLNGKWVKATPAFNISMCEKFGLKPLAFDGHNDSLFHEYDQAGNRHMEYILDRGTYADVPFDEIVTTFRGLYRAVLLGIEGDFQAELGAT